MATLKSDISGHWNSESITISAGTDVKQIDDPGLDLPTSPEDELKLQFGEDLPPNFAWVTRQALENALKN